MSQAPPADVDVTVGLVHALLTEQHHDLAGLPLEVVAHGWDNVVLRLGDDLAVRVPRRTEAARLVEHEIFALPVLAPRLPVPVPQAVRAGRPSSALGYPWVWAVVPWVDGVAVASLPRAERRSLASTLADVLVALHVPAPADAPVNPVRGVPLATRDDAVRERLARLAAPGGYLEGSGLDMPHPTTAGGRVGRQGHDGSARRTSQLLDALVDTWQAGLLAPGHDGPPLWVHGDLHAANLVATPDSPHGLAAVVDWGDVSAGDPATDLAVAWLVLDEPGRDAFLDRLRDRGHPCADDAPTFVRARAWALTMATSMAEYAAPGTGHHRLATGALTELLGARAPRSTL